MSAATRLVALLGHPVAHSLSPQLHNAAFDAVGVDAVYVAFDVAPDAVDTAVAGIAALGFLGANVTVPHKRAAYLAVPRRTAAAELSGAANTLFWDGPDLVADNTDVEGLQRVLTADAGLGAGAEVIVYGAGGAARAAVCALGQIGAVVDVVARRPEAAAEIRDLATTAGAQVRPVTRPQLVINATPLGFLGESLPDALVQLGPGQTALDLVYGAEPTPFLVAARARGAAGLDGRGMLLGQAAAAFQRWTGQPAPLDVMSRALEKSLKVT